MELIVIFIISEKDIFNGSSKYFFGRIIKDSFVDRLDLESVILKIYKSLFTTQKQFSRSLLLCFLRGKNLVHFKEDRSGSTESSIPQMSRMVDIHAESVCEAEQLIQELNIVHLSYNLFSKVTFLLLLFPPLKI